MRTTQWALEGLEHILFGRGHQVARRNAWTAVLEDRRRARARHEAEALLNRAPVPGPARGASVPVPTSASPGSRR